MSIRTRKTLRDIRERCDDALLAGEIPEKLEREKQQMEKKFAAQTKLLKRIRVASSEITPPSVAVSKILSSSASVGAEPRCSCGQRTTVERVRSGNNQNRPYYKCLTCGFSGWVDHSGQLPTAEGETSFVASRSLEDDSMMSQGQHQTASTVLRNVFGHAAFRASQYKIVQEALKGRDAFVLMPTGGGKSLCYQLPAVVDIGITIVVSPLVSLIQDQVEQLQAIDVGVNYLSGEQDYETVQRQIISELYNDTSRMKLLYVTPEKIASSNMLRRVFESLVSRNRLSRFVIDEAHCISQWGHDFRQDYMNLGELRKNFPSVPIMALTATANGRTEADIVKNLRLNNPFIIRSSFNRENLLYDIRPKTGAKVLSEIADFLRSRVDQSGIIYCFSRNDCETVSQQLTDQLGAHSTISYYHAGLDPPDRARRHRDWSKGKIKVIVATVAFGMGINKPDVRFVIHHTIPQSVTHYYQEAGRAGRDGELAHCIMYYNYRDATRRRNIMQRDKQSGGANHFNVHMDNLRRMVEFCENEVECRRTLLLEYFGQQFTREECNGTCDNCKAMQDGCGTETKDVTKACLDVVSLVETAIGNGQTLTLVQTANAFLGKDIGSRKGTLSSCIGFGSGKGMFTRNEADRLLHHMVFKQFIDEHEQANSAGFSTTLISSGRKARELRNGQRIELDYRTKRRNRGRAKAAPVKRAQTSKQMQQVVEILEENEEEEVEGDLIPMVPLMSQTAATTKVEPRLSIQHVGHLIQLLKDWRSEVSDQLNILPYNVIRDGAIHNIARDVPLSDAELSVLDGVGLNRVSKYGASIISILKQYLDRHHIQLPRRSATPQDDVITQYDDDDDFDDEKAPTKRTKY